MSYQLDNWRGGQVTIGGQSLPYHVARELENMPVDATNRFLAEYSSKKKNVVIAYILHIFFAPQSFSYLYLGRFGKQILYWLTFGGLGLWWLVNLFRIPTQVNRKNAEIADDILQKLRVQMSASDIAKIANQLNPSRRALDIPYDPSNLTPENLEVGFLLDYDLKTWKVIGKNQLDWNDGETELELQLSSDLSKSVLHVEMQGAYHVITISVEVSLSLLGMSAQDFSMDRANRIIIFEGKEFYLDQTYTGKYFEGDSNQGKPVLGHYYLDKSRKFWIRIFKLPNGFVSYIGEEVAPESISEILPTYG